MISVILSPGSLSREPDLWLLFENQMANLLQRELHKLYSRSSGYKVLNCLSAKQSLTCIYISQSVPEEDEYDGSFVLH